MLKSIVNRVFGTRHDRERRRVQPIVDAINEQYERLQNVSEEELRGQTAKFRFRGESTDHVGRVISLTGVATAPANLAIQPAALAKEPYRVTVAVPELVKSGRCSVGRTGRVTFGG